MQSWKFWRMTGSLHPPLTNEIYEEFRRWSAPTMIQQMTVGPVRLPRHFRKAPAISSSPTRWSEVNRTSSKKTWLELCAVVMSMMGTWKFQIVHGQMSKYLYVWCIGICSCDQDSVFRYVRSTWPYFDPLNVLSHRVLLWWRDSPSQSPNQVHWTVDTRNPFLE